MMPPCYHRLHCSSSSYQQIFLSKIFTSHGKPQPFTTSAIRLPQLNLSDIAAMGATPTAIFVAIALPLFSHSIMIGKNSIEDWRFPCTRHKVQLLGGDTSSSPSSLFIAITITGQVNSGHILTRQGAKIGHLIYVSGTLGDSAAGLAYLKKYKRPPKPSTLSKPINYLVQRHLQPTARIALGQLLASQPYASAAMDLSDGLSGDLSHLCRQSHVGALIHEWTDSHVQTHANLCETDSGKPITMEPSRRGRLRTTLLRSIPPKRQQELEKSGQSMPNTDYPNRDHSIPNDSASE